MRRKTIGDVSSLSLTKREPGRCDTERDGHALGSIDARDDLPGFSIRPCLNADPSGGGRARMDRPERSRDKRRRSAIRYEWRGSCAGHHRERV